MIVIIDYGMGNLRSVQKAIEAVGSVAVISSDPDDVRQASKVVLPGVGAFADAMAELQQDRAGRGVLRGRSARESHAWAFALACSSCSTRATRTASTQGLGLLPGRVERFAARPGLKIPHMGWNTLRVLRPVPLLAGLGADLSVYFVHSYHAVPENREHVAAEADYPDPFPGDHLAREPDGLPVPSREEPGDRAGDVRAISWG